MRRNEMLHSAASSLAAVACCATAGAAPQQGLESGLLPSVSIIGEPTRTMSLRERMAHYDVPAVSVAVIEGNRTIWSRGYGKLSRRGSDAATAGTLFQGGSLSKPIAAATALGLVQDELLSLDAPVNRFLKSWQVPSSVIADGRQVTVREILRHTSGLGVHGFRGYADREPIPTLVQILDGQEPANSEPIRLVQTPGTSVRYSGGAYTVLQQVIEDVEESFPTVAWERVLRPLGMKNSIFAQPLPVRLRSRAAVGHLVDKAEVPGSWHTLPELAAAGLWSTPSDLARFVIWINRGSRPGASTKHAAITRQMLEPQRDAAGEPFATPSGNQVGLGLVLEGEGPSFRFSHSGSNVGQKALMIGFPATGQGAVVMANSDTSPALIQEIVRAIAVQYRWPERFHRFVRPLALEASLLQRLAGTYRFESRGSGPGNLREIGVSVTPRGLRAAFPDGTTHELRPITSAEFLDPSTEMTLIFGEDGTLKVPAYRILAKRR